MVALRAIVAAGHDVAVVVSRADKRRGRHEPARPSPVKAAALELGLAVSDRPEDAAEVGAELGVVVAFGRIIKKDVLDRLPLVNVHFSLLPRWRGAAPVERAILAGDADHRGLPHGDRRGPRHRAGLPLRRGGDRPRRDRVRAAGPPGGAGRRPAGRRPGRTAWGRPTAQAGPPTYADKIEPADLRLDWSLDAVQLHRVVRLGGPGRPGAAGGCWCWPDTSPTAPAGGGPPGRLAGRRGGHRSGRPASC